MTQSGFDSPGSAAMDGFPSEDCCVVATRVQGDIAYVLLNTHSSGCPYLYGVTCVREANRWFDRGSGNAPGWSQTDDLNVGTLSEWGDAPPGADMVRIEFQGASIEEPVIDGAYLHVWWRVPPPDDWPRVTAFRIAGRWVDHQPPVELLENGDDWNASDLHFAAQDGDMTQVRKLLAEGRSPNAFDEIAKTPLHYAAEGGHVHVIQVLLDAGANVNAHDEARIGNTPLRQVAEKCSLAVATVLVEGGADPRIPGWMQLTALDQAEGRMDEEGQRVYALLTSVAERLNDT